MPGPYGGLPLNAWEAKTRELIDNHPLDPDEIYEVVLQAWQDIFETSIGRRGFTIGVDLFPRPQIMGFFLHELIPLELAHRYPTIWRREESPGEKDIVYVPDTQYSIEIKTSSSTRNIYGNRSSAQKTERRSEKKEKSGYYLAVNFENFSAALRSPSIVLVRFGWLDHEDWQGQTAATGQQAKLSPEVERYKLLKLPLAK